MGAALTSHTKSVRADSNTVRERAPSSSVTNMPATLYSRSEMLLAASTAGMAQGGSECVICAVHEYQTPLFQCIPAGALFLGKLPQLPLPLTTHQDVLQGLPSHIFEGGSVPTYAECVRGLPCHLAGFHPHAREEGPAQAHHVDGLE